MTSPGNMYLGQLNAQDVIDRLWMVAHHCAIDNGTHYAYIRAAIELIEELRND